MSFESTLRWILLSFFADTPQNIWMTNPLRKPSRTSWHKSWHGASAFQLTFMYLNNAVWLGLSLLCCLMERILNKKKLHSALPVLLDRTSQRNSESNLGRTVWNQIQLGQVASWNILCNSRMFYSLCKKELYYITHYAFVNISDSIASFSSYFVCDDSCWLS